MKINNNELKKILTIAGASVDKAGTVDLYKCVKLSVSKNAMVIVACNANQNIIQFAPVVTNDDEKWDALIDYSILSSLVSKFSKEDTIITKIDEKIIIKNGRNSTEVTIASGEQSLFEITSKEEIMQLTKKDWLKYFKPVSYAVATDDTRPILKCVLINNLDGNIDVVALDGYRVAKTTIANQEKKIRTVIDGTTIKNITDILSKYEDDVSIKIFKTDSKIIFTIKMCSIINNIVLGDFLKYELLLPDISNMSSMTVNRDEMLHSLDRLKISKKDVPLVSLSIKGNQLVLLSNSTIAKSKEEVIVASDIKELEIAFNINYLIESLKQFCEETITMYFTNSSEPCVIKNDYMLSLILPVRTKG